MGTNYIFLLCLLLIWLTNVHSEVYPSVQWNHLNPMFETDFTLFVYPTSKMNLVCPNDATVLKRLRDNTPKEQLFENLWFVDKASFDSCTVNVKSSRRLLKCNDPFRLMYFPVVFQQYSPTERGLEFKPGNDYYFISTSDGTVGSLNNTSGGHCKTHNMKLKVHICKMNDTRCVATSTSTQLKTVPTTSPVEKTSLPIIVTEQKFNAHAHRNKNSNDKINTTLPLTTAASRAGTEINERPHEVIDKLKYLLAIGILLAIIITLLLIILILLRKKIFNCKNCDKVQAAAEKVKLRNRNSTSSTREILGVRFSGVNQTDVCSGLNGDCEQKIEQNTC